MIPLVVSKLKATYLASLIVFASIAIPTSTIAVNQSVRDGVKGCFDPVIAGINKVPELFQEHVVENGNEIINKYKGWVQDSKLNEKFDEENVATVTGGVAKSASWLKKTGEFLNEKSDQLGGWAESGNYYTFEFSSIIKSAIDYIPTLSKDTANSIAKGGEMNGYLSLPKLVELFKAEGVKDFGSELVELYKKKPNAFKKIRKEDTDTIFEIIKSLDENNISTFWTDAKNNMKEIENDKNKNYESEKDNVWKDIFIGKDGIQAIIAKLAAIEGYKDDDTIKTIIEGLKDVGDNAFTNLTSLISELKTKLQSLQQTQS